MVHQFRGGIVGCGYFGQIQLEAWGRIPGAEIVAACDLTALILVHERGLQELIDGNRFADPVPPGPAMAVTRVDGDTGCLIIPATGDIFLNGRKIWSSDEEKGYKGDSVRAAQAHFIECLRNREPFETGAREYLKAFGAVEAAYESAARGEKTRVKEWM